MEPQVPFTVEQPVTYPLTPYRAPASTNPIVHTPPKEIMIPGRNRKGEIVPYRESKPKNAIEPYKFEKIKADTDPKPIVKPDPKPKVKEPNNDCPPGKEWNPETRRCRKIVVQKVPKVKVTKKVKEAPKVIQKIPSPQIKACPPGKEINPKTNLNKRV